MVQEEGTLLAIGCYDEQARIWSKDVSLGLIHLLSAYISSKNKPSQKTYLLDINIALLDMTVT